jgi:hypothetical protein
MLPFASVIDPELKVSGWVGSGSSATLVDGGGLEALVIKAGSRPAASGFENGPIWRTGGVWFGESGGLPDPLDGRLAPIWFGGSPGDGKT